MSLLLSIISAGQGLNQSQGINEEFKIDRLNLLTEIENIKDYDLL